jgi:hypothetical protein
MEDFSHCQNIFMPQNDGPKPPPETHRVFLMAVMAGKKRALGKDGPCSQTLPPTGHL